VKNRTTSGPSQPPCKLNQNKGKVCHDTKKTTHDTKIEEKTPTTLQTQNRKEKSCIPHPPLSKEKKPKPLG